MSDPGLLARLWPHRGALAVLGVVVGVGALVPAGLVVLVQQIVDRVLLAPRPETLVPAVVALIVLPIAEGLLAVARAWLTKRVAWTVAADVRVALFHRWLLLDAPEDTGTRIAALADEADELTYAVPALVGLVRQPLALLALGVTATWLAPMLVPAALLAAPVLAVVTRWSGRHVQSAAAGWRAARVALIADAQDPIANRRIIADAGAADSERDRLSAAVANDRDRRVDLEVARVVPRAATRVLAGLGLGALLAVGGGAVQVGALAPGGLVGFVVALALAVRPAGSLAEAWSLWQRAAGARDRLAAVLDRAIVPRAPEHPQRMRDGPLTVDLDGVTVALGGRAVLRDVCVDARPGQVLALVGPSGVGKSTLLSLIARHRDPDDGVVRVGGVDVRELDPIALRRRVGAVRQEAELLDRTVRENLCLAGPADDARLWAALDAADAGFLARSGRGLDTPLGEGGRVLSGGERQRLCLARALVHDPPVLVLDEPTNQVDPATAQAIARAIRRLTPGRTVIVATHDPILLAAADRIAELTADGLRVRGVG